MVDTTDIYGNTYQIKQCTEDDLLVHYEMVAELIPESDLAIYPVKMRECVQAGTAFALEDDSCFIYYLNYRPVHAHGYSLYGKGEPHKLMALMLGVFTQIDTKTYKLDFVPHRDPFIREYKSIITPVSLRRRSRSPKRPLVIRIDELKKKWAPLFKARGIQWAAY